MWNKIRSVLAFQMRLIFSTPRIVLIFILIALFVFSNLQGVLDFSRDVDIPVTPWGFPHLTSDFICQLVIMAGAVALFCDAPFKSEIETYILPRAGYTAWTVGQCIYIVVLSFLYVFMILVFSILPFLSNIDFRNSWGKIWGTLARSMAGVNYGIPFSADDYVIGAYKPLQATALSFLLSWGCCIWLGLLTYLVNSLSGSYVGTFLSAGFVMMDVTVANEWLPWFYKISPVTLAQLQALKGSNSVYQVTLQYAFQFFGISIIFLLIGCILTPKLQNLRRKRHEHCA